MNTKRVLCRLVWSGILTTLCVVARAETVTPIADIHQHLVQYMGQTVTVQGQVYIPSNYRGTSISGYIQDQSGRGINVFGSSMDDPLLQDIGNFVQVTAVVDSFFWFVELVDATSIALISSGNPPLAPAELSTGAARSRAWEGTYIQCIGPIVAVATTGGETPTHSYTINDGTGSIVVRVVDHLGAPLFSLGQTITARGAGNQFFTDYLIWVGLAGDVFLGTVAVNERSWSGVKVLYHP